ncbi:TIGR01777 family oxidoreductase [Pseudalkalibacillus sp. Hm43]|uniref:TIGR01777 family oxidoreductase n=1 Tax=Pseudalkalibacillus sp. Hm43 TaxID=3450742 RepID=UPI003F41EA61
MKKKVVLAGGTGFIGQYFEKQLIRAGYEVLIISRKRPHITWENQHEIIDALEGADMLINLAGKSVNCRYHEQNRKTIMDSRIETTQMLGQAVEQCSNPPSLWINSSTATIYRHAEDRPMTEDDGELGTGFSVNVAQEWEKTFFNFKLPQTRQVALRTAIVLGPGGGVMTPYKYMVKFGLGGVQGSGNQMFSWIHVEDLWRIVLFLKEHDELSGVFNCSSPDPITNRELMQQLRDTLGRKVGMSSPRWMLEIGSFFLRTEAELVLKSRWVLPERLEKEGFKFKYETINDALVDAMK